MKKLYNVIKQELREGENIWINHQSDFEDMNNENWWKFEEYTFDEIFNVYSSEEKVLRYWHEEGLCIILK